MKQELQDKLFKRFDHMFRERKIKGSCMSRQMECGDGWFSLLWDLCTTIQRELSKHPGLKQEFAVLQVKSKLASLRFYTNGSDDKIQRLIEDATNLSGKTCEYCGEEGKAYNIKGWMETLCLLCLRKSKKKELPIE